MEKITLSIFVPCFNKEKSITKALNCIKEGVQNINYEIIVVDDGSKDKTIEMIENFKKNNPNINIQTIYNQNNKGLGFNYFATAHKASGKYYMMVSGAAVEPPNEIKKIVSNIGKADMILIYINDKRGIFRKTISKIFVIVINLITLNNLKYYNGPNIHLVENVKSYREEVSGFNFAYHHQAGFIVEQIRQKKTYIEILIEPYVRTSKTSETFTPYNIVRIVGALMSIFLNQIIYLLKKIMKKL